MKSTDTGIPTAMGDNQTTELKSLSKLKNAGKLRYWRGTIEIPESELHEICDEIQAEHDRILAEMVREYTDLIADTLAPVCVDEEERRAFERGRVHERFAQQIFKEATS